MSKQSPERPQPQATLAILDQEFGDRIYVPAANLLPKVTRNLDSERTKTIEDIARKAGESLTGRRLKLSRSLFIPHGVANGFVYLFHRVDGDKISLTEDMPLNPITGGLAPSPWMELEHADETFNANRYNDTETIRASWTGHFAVRAIQAMNREEEWRKFVISISTDPEILQDPSIHP